jgi:hypothetical protein
MTRRKERLTVTVDPELLAAGNAAVAAGRADSLSGWVSEALADRVARDQRLAALDVAIAEYEAHAGVITDDELREQRRIDRANAVVVRGRGVA